MQRYTNGYAHLSYEIAEDNGRAAARIYRKQKDGNRTTLCLHVCIKICAITGH